MIEARELRIGNLVTDEFYDSFKTIIEVDSISDRGINLFIDDDGNYPECAQTWIEPEERFDTIFGIPLTEEWILTLPKNKLKFNMKREYVFEAIRFIINKYIILTIHNDGIVSLGLLNQSFSIQLKYVHTFQNLYFALTGNELPLNL